MTIRSGSGYAPLKIVSSIDFLLTLTVAHHLVRWWEYPGVMAKLLGIVAILVVVNDWLTTRSSYELYSVDIFALDLAVLLVLNGLPFALASGLSPVYFPFFWLLLAVCELLYAMWDLTFRRRAEETAARKALSLWVIASIFGAMLYGSTALLHFLAVDSIVAFSLTGASSLYVIGMLVVWNVNRYKQNVKAGLAFLE